jgi:hypothetical protein
MHNQGESKLMEHASLHQRQRTHSYAHLLRFTSITDLYVSNIIATGAHGVLSSKHCGCTEKQVDH